MAKNSLFRSSLGGYNKNDVSKYIEELNIQYSDRGAELEGEIKQLKKELEVLPELLAEKERAERLALELEILRQENADLSDAIKAQGQELEESKKQYSELLTEKEALEIRTKEMAENEEKLRNECAKVTAEFNVKTQELRSLSNEAESLKTGLEQEKSDFEKRAELMLAQIQEEAKSIIDKANRTADLIIEDAKSRVQDSNFSASFSAPAYSKKKDGFSDLLEGHRSKMDSFFATIAKTLKGDSK